MKNLNHPKQNSTTLVEPIKDIEHINSIKKLLSNQPRNLLLFILGINNGIRTGDILKLRVKDVSHLKVNGSILIKESKTNKSNILVFNKQSYNILKLYLESENLNQDDYLFKSQKGRNQPISIPYVNNLIKSWCKTINLSGNYGSHTLRKTFGYIQRTKFGVGFEILCKRFNHSSPTITMRYLGISDKEVMDILQHEI